MKNARWMMSVALVIGIIMICGLMINAEEWSIYGPRAQGMGGAGVATADSNTAHYWNPGATSSNKDTGIYINAAFCTSAEGDILSAVDKVATTGQGIDWAVINAGGVISGSDAGKLLNFFSLASTEFSKPGQGLLVSTNAGLSFTIGKFTFFGNNFIFGNLDPIGDDQNLLINTGASAITDTVGSTSLGSPTNAALASNIASQTWWIAGAGNASMQADNLIWLAEAQGADTSDPEVQDGLTLMAQNLAGGDPARSYQNNQTGVIINGLLLTEFGVSYSKPVIEDMLTVGGNLKLMEGQTFFKKISYQNLQNTDDMMKDVTDKNAAKTSTAFGVDVGGLLTLSENFHGGLVIRNLNSPKFSYAGAGDVTLDPQIRAGVSGNVRIPILGKITVAADYDVTKNKSDLLPGYESQMFGMGAELNMLMGFLKVRAGTQQNLASDIAQPVLTGGIGIQLIWLSVDLAGAFSSAKSEVDAGGKEQPQRAAGTLSIALKF